MQETKKEKKFISVVVYLHNAQKAVEKFVEQVIPFFQERFTEFEIIFVNDGCTDATVGILKEYLNEHPLGAMINIIHMSYFQGMESAMNAGVDLAIGDFVYEFDDIFIDYEKELLWQVYEKLLEGNDIVAAGRKGHMRLSSKIFYFLYNRTSKSKEKIGPETFRIVSRRAINRVKSMGQYIPYRKAVYANCGLGNAKIEYESLDTSVQKRQKAASSERTSLAFDSFIYFTDALQKVSMLLSVLFLLVTVAMGCYVIWDALGADKPIEGWLSTMSFLSLGFFGVFTLLTIILKYLSVLLNLIFKQQRCLIADIEKVVKN